MIQWFFFFVRGLQGVSDSGKKQQNPGRVGPSVVTWAGGGILSSTASMPTVTNAFTPCSTGSHSLHGYVIFKASGGNLEIQTWKPDRHILGRSTIQKNCDSFTGKTNKYWPSPFLNLSWGVYLFTTLLWTPRKDELFTCYNWQLSNTEEMFAVVDRWAALLWN